VEILATMKSRDDLGHEESSGLSDFSKVSIFIIFIDCD
jgi:hypothetical protein